ncbi:hypothetical protein ABZ805_29025 [Saccharopolyspora sp. NPDC047091]|uniref:hypothetical protein n=1 Tax=Saccharopolyspora sp. NPDC047091 TaxID=3155924 RepID=UPI0033DEC951
MRNLPIDSTAIEFISTGKVIPKPQYVDMGNGEKKPDRNRQATDTVTGELLWAVDCIDTADDDESRRAETIAVTVSSNTRPEVAKFRPVQFTGLVANVYLPRGSKYPAFTFRATGVVSGSASAPAPKSTKAAEAA